MGRPPAYIFVVRHGNRLDTADHEWHLHSPTPYDPPLTYGGWMHSRNVGARIAAILEDEANRPTPESDHPHSHSQNNTKKHRRFRIVLHSSPFLRCIQTSIAISAGLASNPSTTIHPGLSSAKEKTSTTTNNDYFSNHDISHTHHYKSVLRVDPFLGEWLSPDYFEHITPPPRSALMIATAKAELLRRSSYHDYPHYHAHIHASASTHLWNNASSPSPVQDTHKAHDAPNGSSLDTLSHIAKSLPGHDDNSHERPGLKGARKSSRDAHHTPGYVFPVPSYALKTSDPIPRGYVAHARDACVAVDYQWDSSRNHLAWGDGGMLPEEWTSMHQRFRRGLRRLVDWYSTTDNPGEMVTKTAYSYLTSNSDHHTHDDDEYDEIEDVVVLVSHGAGCNALVGAITQQPVLADVAMSSLTMAKRRADFDPANIGLPRNFSGASLDVALPRSSLSMPEMYDLKFFANTDHLVTPSAPAFNRPPPIANTKPLGRFNSDYTGYTSALKEINFGSLYGNSSGNGQGNSTNASLGSIRKPSGGPSLVMGSSVYKPISGGITVGSGVSHFSTTRPDRSGSGTWGLWSPRKEEEPNQEAEPSMLLDFGFEKEAREREKEELESNSSSCAIADSPISDEGKTKNLFPASDHHDEEHDNFDEIPVPRLWGGTGNVGLWGTPTPPGEAERLRDFTASKRRWTVTER